MNDHKHNFYAFQMKTSFEPTGEVNELKQALYIMVDYMYLSCSCGEARKALAAVKHSDASH